MDITSFIVSHRENALLAGDYNSYRAQLSRRLHTLRKKLGQTTPRGKKYSPKPTITAENVAKDTSFAFLILLSAERAWATAMHMKSTHSADPSTKGIVGSARRHIISRLNKATIYARQLVSVLQDPSAASASNIDLLEARGYLASLLGAFWMEKKKWNLCSQQYSLAKVIYGALSTKAKREAYRDLLSTTIDPGLQYAAYQLKLPRSAALESIAIKNIPSDSSVRGELTAIDPDCLSERGSDKQQTTADGGAIQDIPQSITWRSRTVALEDAAISQALAAASLAESQLASWLSSPAGQSSSQSEKAANYDNVIIASQDAVDATKTAIDELSAEGIDQGDNRMQALQVTRTAVNYALVGWRVGRNRMLCGADDGVGFEGEQVKGSGGKQKSGNSGKSVGRRLARLRERTALYDATLQSLDFIRELPGVAGDANFVEELNAKHNYFQSLRCLAIGRAHSFLTNPKNALALFSRALDLACSALPPNTTHSQQQQQQQQQPDQSPPRLDVSSPQITALRTHLQSLVWQYHGIVEIERISSQPDNSAPSSLQLPPMIERLDEYPASDSHVDLTRLVTYPPKMEPIPVKPLFLDVAFNYIDYPGKPKRGLAAGADAGADGDITMQDGQASEAKKPAKKGWFGFGR
ncbi:hypothetical protein ACJ73_03480 [Blastomyces percursus]|uniref:Signal recognition particle subunit SRP68 n=1 Tax=Blastomyces percursus TaxID=1658174 RepID=A0A1J9Q8P8_9EURO|nr:hypothetical protein ACJ73_03480 [Blastomyces percursus]